MGKHAGILSQFVIPLPSVALRETLLSSGPLELHSMWMSYSITIGLFSHALPFQGNIELTLQIMP
jgi:hypothetical protein